MADHGVELGRQLLALVSSPAPPAGRPRTGSGQGAVLDAAQADFIRALMAPPGGRVPARPPPGLGVPSGATSARPPPPPGFPRSETSAVQAPVASRDAAAPAVVGPTTAPAVAPVLEELPSMPAQHPHQLYAVGGGVEASAGSGAGVPANVPYAVVPSGGAGGSVSYIPLQVVPVPAHVAAAAPGDGLQWGGGGHVQGGGQGLLQQGAGGVLYMPPSWISSHGAAEATAQQQGTLQAPDASGASHEQLLQQQQLQQQYQQYQQLQHAYAQANAAQAQQQQHNHMMQQYLHQQSLLQLHQAQVSAQQQQQARAQESAPQLAPQQYYYHAPQQQQQPPPPQQQLQSYPQQAPPFTHQAEYASQGYAQPGYAPGGGPSFLQQQPLPQQDSAQSSPPEQPPQAPAAPSPQASTMPLVPPHDTPTPATTEVSPDTSVASPELATAPAQVSEATARRLERIAEAQAHQARRRHAGQLARRGQAAVQGEEDRLLVWLSQVRIKPKAPISITIVGPASEYGPEHVGLFKASAPDCRKYFAMRTARTVAGLDGARIAHFHAPKGHGLYDVRVFATDDEDCTPIGRSAPFAVEVQGHDLIEAVTYGHSTLLDTMLELKLIGQYAYDEARGASIKEQTQRRDAALKRAAEAAPALPSIEEQLTGLMPPSGTAAAWAFFAHRVRAAELEFSEARATTSLGEDAAAGAPPRPRSSLAEAFGSLPAPSATDITRLTSCLANLRALMNQVRYVPLVFPGPAIGRWTGTAASPSAGAYTEAASNSAFLTVNPELCECLWRALRDARFCALLCALFVRASVLSAFPPSSAAQGDSSPCVTPPAAFEWAGDAGLIATPASSVLVSSVLAERNAFLAAPAAHPRAEKERSIDLAVEAASRMRALRSLHGEVAALMQDVLGSSGLRSILLRHRAALVSQWRQCFDPLSETLLPLSYELRQLAERRAVPASAGGKPSADIAHKQGAGSLSTGDISELMQLVKQTALDIAPASQKRRLQAAVARQACDALQAYADHVAFSQAHSALVAASTKAEPAAESDDPKSDPKSAAPSAASAGAARPAVVAPRSLVPPDVLSASAIAALSKALHSRATTLFPSETFAPTRETVRARVAAALAPLQRGSAAGGREFGVSLFGSSANGFGGDSADVDMALTPSLAPDDISDKAAEASASTWNAVALMEEAAELLDSAGLGPVQVRLTSRIPIVLFVDPESGLQCDVCAGNPLAERNTALLRTYSEADLRVRELGFLVKNWAALRRLNDPSNHTLSSYAYILMSLSVLLSRAPNPVVPCLQELAPEWPARSSGDALAASDLPLELRLSPEGINYDTYFWQPPQASDLGASAAPTASLEKGPVAHAPPAAAAATLSPLQDFASSNTEPIGRLFLEFLWYYAFEFDPRTTVVAVNRFDDVDAEGEALQHRARHPFAKCRARFAAFSQWRMGSALSIEDPFEHDYDVAHVLKPQEWRVLRLELGLAYSTLAAALQSASPAASTIDAAVDAVFTALPFAHGSTVPPRRTVALGMRRTGGDDDAAAHFEDHDLSLEEAAENAAKATPALQPRAALASRWSRPPPAAARPPLMGGGGRRGFDGPPGGVGGGFQGRAGPHHPPADDRRAGSEGWRRAPLSGRFTTEWPPPAPQASRDGGGGDDGGVGRGGFTYQQRAPPHYPHAYTATLEDGTHVWSPNGPPPPGHDPHRPWPMAAPGASATGALPPTPLPAEDRLPPPAQQQYVRAQFEQPIAYGPPPPHQRQPQPQQQPHFYPPPQGYYPPSQQQQLYAPPPPQQQHVYGGGSGGGFHAGSVGTQEPWGGGFGPTPPGAPVPPPYPGQLGGAPAPFSAAPLPAEQQWYAPPPEALPPPPQQQQQQQHYERGW